VAESSPIPPTSTFVVRFWREWSAAGPRWRARIEHVQSGESASYLDPLGISEFMQHLGIKLEDTSGPGDVDV